MEQAIALADTLIDLDTLAIYASTRLRCLQTADALNSFANIGVVTEAFASGALVCTEWQGMPPE